MNAISPLPVERKSQSHRTAQGNSKHKNALNDKQNPDAEVAIPPCCSGQLQSHQLENFFDCTDGQVAIPPYCSGR